MPEHLTEPPAGYPHKMTILDLDDPSTCMMIEAIYLKTGRNSGPMKDALGVSSRSKLDDNVQVNNEGNR